MALAEPAIAGSAIVPALLPQPQEVSWREGFLTVRDRRELQERIRFETDASLPSEGYRLEVSAEDVRIASSDSAGRFYALQTLDQVAERHAGGWRCRVCRIVDTPFYRWRGVMLDEGRHFFGRDAVKKLLNLMARFKLNRLHWHLTEDQGWRIDIPKYPRLVQRGSRRAETPKWNCETNGNGQAYGPCFYYADEIREIVEYAAARHVEIVPEFELPGHARAAVAAYPSLGCPGAVGADETAWGRWGISKDVFCVGNDETIRFCEDILDYLCELFPSKTIHLGGDECPRDRWEACVRCQARIKAEGLGDVDGLQRWLVGRMAAHLAKKKGRRAMGWSEVAESGEIPRSTIVQCWRESFKAEAREVAQRGYDLVSSMSDLTYWTKRTGVAYDPYPYREWAQKAEPLTLKLAYSFDPALGVAGMDREHVLGGECCIWTEGTPDASGMEWKTWPRTLAVAETLWCGDRKPAYEDFVRRAAVFRAELVRTGVNCSPIE